MSHKEGVTSGLCPKVYTIALPPWPAFRRTSPPERHLQASNLANMNVKRTARALLRFMRKHPNLQQLRNNPTGILQAMDQFSAEHDFLINIGSDKGRIVTDLIAREKPKTLVELGGYVGYSSILFASQMRKFNPDARLWSLEFDPEHARIIAEMVNLAGLQETITVITGSGGESMRMLKRDGHLDNIDMLFLDHDENLYRQDLEVAMDESGLLKTGAVVVADNVVWPGAPEYRRYVRNHQRMSSKGVKGRIVPGNILASFVFAWQPVFANRV